MISLEWKRMLVPVAGKDSGQLTGTGKWEGGSAAVSTQVPLITSTHLRLTVTPAMAHKEQAKGAGEAMLHGQPSTITEWKLRIHALASHLRPPATHSALSPDVLHESKLQKPTGVSGLIKNPLLTAFLSLSHYSLTNVSWDHLQINSLH